MAAVMEYVMAPQNPRDTRSFQELFTSLHKEVTELGPRGTLLVFSVLFSSTGVLLGRGATWLYRKAAGYA